MNREFFAEVSEVFLGARVLDGAERASFLHERCGERVELRRAVERLLEQDGHQSDGFDDSAMVEGVNLEALQGLLSANGTPHEGGSRPPQELPETLGRFRIVRRLGEGGMGVVCEAEQDSPRRRVALKLLRTGLRSEAMAKRFTQEAQVLARLQHPGIARVFEAGVASTPSGGQPYFAMELISGRPLLEYTAELGIPERLGVFLEVCEAVEYAHGRGVIHRDLKPMNILVDEHGHPRVLDFGVARVTDADIQATTLHTDPGQLVGTLPYMSPEQIDGNLTEVDARTDVYAMGVVLFQMLSGRLPLDTRSRTIAEAARIIRDREPTRLGSLDTSLRGDLETIVSRAIEKDADRRYQSISSLAADVERYLHHQPIDARPSSRLYLARKFVRRHPELVGGVTLALAVLIVGVAGTSWGLVRALQSKREAERLTTIVLSTLGPGYEMTEQRTARIKSVLNEALRDLRPPLDLLAQSDLFANIAERYGDLGLYEESVRFFGQAHFVSSQARGRTHVDTVALLGKLAVAMCRGSPPAEQMTQAAALAQEARTLAESAVGPEHELTRRLAADASWVKIRAAPNAEGRQELDRYLQFLKGNPSRHAGAIRRTVARIAWYLERTSDLFAAESAYRELLELIEGAQSGSAAERGSALYGLGHTLERQGRLAEAVEVLTKAFDVLRAKDDDVDSPSMNWIVDERGRALLNLGRYDEAADNFRLMLDRWSRSRGSQVWDAEATRSNYHELLGYALGGAGRTSESDRELREAMRAEERAHGPRTPRMAALERMRALYVDIGIGRAWSCGALRSHMAVLGLNVMDQADPEVIRPLRWPEARFRLERWAGTAGGPAGTDVYAGRIEDLRSVQNVRPGVYLLAVEVPQASAPPRDWQVWVLIAPWEFKLYNMPFDPPFAPGRWEAMVSEAPAEVRHEWGVCWWDVFDPGFGPGHRTQMFGLTGQTELGLPPGDYQLEGVSDDGIEVEVGDARWVSNWRTQYATQFKFVGSVTGDGPVRIGVRYYQYLGGFNLRLTMNPTGPIADAFAARVKAEVHRDLEAGARR